MTDFSVRKVFGAGSNGTSDPALHASAPWSPTESAMMENGEVLFIPNGRDYPASFSGAISRHEKHLQWLGGANTAVGGGDIPPTLAMRVLGYPDEVGVVSGLGDNRFLLKHEGTWTYHTFDVTVGAWLAAGSIDHIVIASPGADATAAQFYTMRTYRNRPGQVGANHESAGDGQANMFPAEFSMPESWAKEGEEVLVRHVTIDFLKYLPNTAQTNHFDLTVTALRKYQGIASVSTARNYDGPQGEGNNAGVQQRIQLDFGDQGSGNGFQLNFSNLRGVAIQKIQVHTQTIPARVV